MEKQIGDPGKSMNFSQATRALNIEPDLARVKQYDTHIGENKKQKIKHLAWLLIALPFTIKLIQAGHPFWAIIPGIIFLFNFFRLIVLLRFTPATPYKNGLLIPSIITETDPIQIVAMAEVQTSEDTPVCWGLKQYTVQDLPDQEIKIGGKVPCVAMFGTSLMAGVWGKMDVYPVCWATGEKAMLDEAANVIGEEEWQILEKLIPVVLKYPNADHLANNIIYFNDDLTERVDLYEKQEKKEKENEQDE